MGVDTKKADNILFLQAKQLLGEKSIFSQIAIDSAIIRSVLWLDSEAVNPVHTSRIINQALKFSVCDPQELNPRERLKDTLNNLIFPGDLVSFAGGRWLPAVLKEIIIDSDFSESLLAGGIPTHIFPKTIRKEITHHKQYRKIRSGLIDGINDLPKLSLNSWAKIPDIGLEIWSEKVRRIELKEFSINNDGSQYEVYLPESQLRGNSQQSRWKNQFDKHSGKFLCRWKHQIGNTTHHIAQLIHGSITALSDSLPKYFEQRFMYAEDERVKKNVTAKVTIHADELIIDISNYLPRGEYMILDSLGELIPDRFLVWKFDIKYQHVIYETLQRLKIKIKEI